MPTATVKNGGVGVDIGVVYVSRVSGRGTNVGALVTYHPLVRQAASGETLDTIPERTPQVGSRALHNEPAAIDVRPLPTNAWVGAYPSADLASGRGDRRARSW